MVRHLGRPWFLLGLAACAGSADHAKGGPSNGDSGESADSDTGALPGDDGPAGVTVPLGDTIFFDGDDYVADLGVDADCTPVVESAPVGSGSGVLTGMRLTPDVSGLWQVRCGDFEVRLEVQADALNTDTFLNYNYTPVSPIAAVNETTLLVATPTSNAVQMVTTDGTPTATTLIPTAAWPTSVAWWEAGGLALVTQTGRDSLGFLDPSTARIVDAIQVGDEPAGVVVAGDRAYVSISGEDRVTVVDLAERVVVDSVETGRDPRALRLSPDGRYLYVSALLSSNEHRHGTAELPTEPRFQRDLTVIETTAFEVVQTVPEVGTILRGLWTDGERLVVGVSHSNNDIPDVDATTRPHAHGLAVLALEDGLPTGAIEHIDLDLQASSSGPAPSPFTIESTPDGTQLVVSLSAGASLLVLNPETFEEVGRIPTGNDPRGLTVQGGMLWTTPWLDNRLEGFALPISSGARPQHSVDVGADPRPEDVRRGQELFNDARFSASEAFSCNNCHIDGVVDGLTWDLLVDGNVNTIPFRNVAGTDPFLWTGLLPTLFDFSRELLKLVGANATGADMEALTTYMQSVTAPPNPHTLPGGRYTEAGLRGKRLFEGSVTTGGAGCADCHSGPLFTNQRMVLGKTEGKETDVPGLIGVYDSAPYGRVGSWATLGEMVHAAVDYTGADALSAAQRDDIIAYVEQIPGDALWLNGARPLSGDDYVSPLTDIELTFSSVLAPGQAEHAQIHRVDADGTPHEVAGTWTVRGRSMRFTPTTELLEDTAYEVRVTGGLLSNLGRVMADDLVLVWATGAHAELDVSGRHAVTLRLTEVLPDLISDDPQIEFSLLQSSGGNVTAVVHFSGYGVDLSHAEGVVVGSRLLIEPFFIDSDFGELQLDAAYLDCVDLDGDGYADEGTGVVETFGLEIPWDSIRLTLPD